MKELCVTYRFTCDFCFNTDYVTVPEKMNNSELKPPSWFWCESGSGKEKVKCLNCPVCYERRKRDRLT